MPFVAIWRFSVAADKVPDFVSVYGPDGTWTELFRRAEGFISTRLVQDHNEKGVFITIDSWTSQAAYAAFRENFADAYAAIDLQCAALTENEVCVAQGESVPHNAVENLHHHRG